MKESVRLGVGGSRSWGKVRLVVWWYLGATPAASKRVIPVVSYVTCAHWDESLALPGVEILLSHPALAPLFSLPIRTPDGWTTVAPRFAVSQFGGRGCGPRALEPNPATLVRLRLS